MVLDWSFQPFLSVARERYAKRMLYQSFHIQKRKRRRESANEIERKKQRKKTAIHWKKENCCYDSPSYVTNGNAACEHRALLIQPSRVFIATSDSILCGNLLAQHKKGFLQEGNGERARITRPLHASTNVHIQAKIFLSAWIMDSKLSEWFTSQNVNICCQTPDEHITIFHDQ